jgi:NADPH:quinone reductase-like Zn-dependent oxidoreductase
MPRQTIAESYDGLSGITVRDVPPAIAEPGRVVIAVRAAGVNRSDLKSAKGMFGSDESKLPLRLGAEISGVVTAVGEGVDTVAPGDEVVAYRVSGGFADEVVAPATAVFRKPASLGWDEAAGLLLVGATAWHLVEATGVHDGDVVVVNGASGGVGSLAVQLCIERGATVVGIASASSADTVRALGAEPVERGPGLLERLRAALADGATVALDTVGNDDFLDAAIAVVPDRQRIATIEAFERGAELGILRLGGGPGADPGSAIRNAARQPLLDLAAAGVISVRLGRTFPLDDVRDALALVWDGHPNGKVVLVP